MPELHLPAPYPLTWPEGRPRTPAHKRVAGHYTARDYSVAMAGLDREITRWQARERPERITEWQITATHSGRGHLPNNAEPGASLWFVLGGQTITAGRQLMVLACDKFDELAQNIRALALTMERLRLVADIGAYSIVQAVEGARALPPPKRVIDWRARFGLAPGAAVSRRMVDAIYRTAAGEAGEGSPALASLNEAIAAAREELKTSGED